MPARTEVFDIRAVSNLATRSFRLPVSKRPSYQSGLQIARFANSARSRFGDDELARGWRSNRPQMGCVSWARLSGLVSSDEAAVGEQCTPCDPSGAVARHQIQRVGFLKGRFCRDCRASRKAGIHCRGEATCVSSHRPSGRSVRRARRACDNLLGVPFYSSVQRGSWEIADIVRPAQTAAAIWGVGE
jgi:hypothetical protein